MSGIEPPREPVAPAPLVHPLTVPPRRRSWLPVFIGAGVVAVLGMTLAGFLMSTLAASIIDRADLAAAEQVVLALDAAYADADCDAFEAATTEDARQQILDRNYDCEAFEAAAAALADAGEYAYSVEVLRSAKYDDTVVVTTRESYGDEATERYNYLLENDGSGWVIAEYGQQ